VSIISEPAIHRKKPLPAKPECLRMWHTAAALNTASGNGNMIANTAPVNTGNMQIASCLSWTFAVRLYRRQRIMKSGKPPEPLENHSKGNVNMTELTATNLKSALWDTLNSLKAGNMQPAEGDAIASQAREILRTTNTQLRISQQSKRPVPADVIGFSEK